MTMHPSYATFSKIDTKFVLFHNLQWQRKMEYTIGKNTKSYTSNIFFNIFILIIYKLVSKCQFCSARKILQNELTLILSQVGGGALNEVHHWKDHQKLQ